MHTPEAIACDAVAVRYPYAPRPAVGPLSLQVRRGERVLLLGPSGCGKSSLLHTLTGLIPRSIAAERDGQIRLFGHPAEARSPAQWADRVALLFQDVEQTLAGLTVEDEIAFALENCNIPAGAIEESVVRAMDLAGLPPEWRMRRIATLSGGQKQIVALAAVLAQDVDAVIADEPTASLAPKAARLMADRLLARGRTTLIVDHRLGPILDRIDRVIVLGAGGQLLAEGAPDSVFAEFGAALIAEGIWTPLAVRVREALARQGVKIPPVTQVKDLLACLPPETDLKPLLLPQPVPLGPERVRLEHVACAPPFGPVVVEDVSFSLRGGEVLGIIGPNGAGKSTLAACLAGLVPPRKGRRHGAPGAIAFQNAEAHFSADTVRAELAAVGLPAAAVAAVLEEWGLGKVAEQHPFTLSMGQKRRLALALLTATKRWPLLVLDEPTAGLDFKGTEIAAAHIRRLAGTGRAIAVITHDADFALSVCDRIAVLAPGRLAAIGPASDVLRNRVLLEAQDLAPPEAAGLLEWVEQRC
nr:ATP-binding cassette domain-containing protein [Pseudohoeflea sp. DP4N28-3]